MLLKKLFYTKKYGTKKYKLFGLTIVKSKKSNLKKKVKILGIPVFKKNFYPAKTKYYLFGIKCHTKKLQLPSKYKIKQYTKIPIQIHFKKTENPLVSIIIPVYNQVDYTKKCLYSIFESKDTTPYEIIIADDHSSDGTKHIKSFAKNITVIRNEKNLGYIGNCNNAARFAKGKYLYFLNNDTQVQEKWLEKLVAVFQTRKNVGVVGSKIVMPNGMMQECGVYIYADGFQTGADSRFPDLPMNCYLKKCDYVSGCSLLTPKSLFDDIGGFDERYSPAYCDDPDYCLSALKRGYDTYVQPQSVVLHFGSISYGETNKPLKKRNNILLREKWPDFFNSRTTYKPVKKHFSGMTRPASILVIDDLLPQHDKHAGGKTIFQYLQLLTSKNLTVKFCPLHATRLEEPYYTQLCNMGIEVIPTQYIHEYIEEHIDFIDYILLSRPDIAQKFMIKSLQHHGVKVLYYGHDLHHLRMEREMIYEDNKRHTPQKTAEMKVREEHIIKYADMAYYPSVVERDYVRDVFGLQNVTVLPPYLYKASDMPPHNNFEQSNNLIFVGSSHGPNLNGLKWFVKDIFPKIIEQLPDIVLHIVGSSLNAEIKAMASKNIKIMGFLTEEELNELYARTRLSIAPLRYGAGIKGKVIDALYHRVPVVTTPIGAEGILNAGDILGVADNADDFAKKLVEMYNTDFWKAESIKNFETFISNNYSFEKAWQVFEKEINLSERDNNK